MDIPIRHHYIPQMILRNFTDEKGQLYCFSKESGNIFRSKPRKIFVKSHLYTQYDEHGGKDVSVERELSSSIEGPVTPVVKKIVKAARNGKVPGLTQSEKSAWDEFFCCQLRRLPTSRELLSDAEIVWDTLAGFERDVRPLADAERRKYADPELQRELTHNAWVKIIQHPEGQLMDAIQSRGLVVAVIINPNKSFIIGDNPFIRIPSQGCASLKNPKVELLLPISHDVIVTLGLLPENERLFPMTDTEYIRKLNEAIFIQSDFIVTRSQKLIESLSGKRATRRDILN